MLIRNISELKKEIINLIIIMAVRVHFFKDFSLP